VSAPILPPPVPHDDTVTDNELAPWMHHTARPVIVPSAPSIGDRIAAALTARLGCGVEVAAGMIVGGRYHASASASQSSGAFRADVYGDDCDDALANLARALGVLETRAG
jgi:hypothetical protein